MPLERWLIRDRAWPVDALVEALGGPWVVEEGWASYEHPDTGTRFALIWSPPAEIDAGPWAEGRRVLLRLNLLRPRSFGVEAAEVCATLAERLEARDEGGERWSAAALIEQWEQAERGAFASLAEIPEQLYGYAHAELEEIWRWNLLRTWLASLSPALFVPRISFVEEGGEARSAVVWTDLVPMVLPAVDRVFALRTRGPGEPGLVALPAELIAEHCAPAARVTNVPRPQRVVGHPEEALHEFVAQAARVEPRGLEIDQVIDDDLLALAGR